MLTKRGPSNESNHMSPKQTVEQTDMHTHMDKHQFIEPIILEVRKKGSKTNMQIKKPQL